MWINFLFSHFFVVVRYEIRLIDVYVNVLFDYFKRLC